MKTGAVLRFCAIECSIPACQSFPKETSSEIAARHLVDKWQIAKNKQLKKKNKKTSAVYVLKSATR